MYGGAVEGGAATTAQKPWQEEPRGSYPDPRVLALSGLERLQLWQRGLAPRPPLNRLTGAMPSRFGSGTADADMPATDWLLNSAGVIGGGVLAIPTDIAFGCAAQTEIGPAVTYTTAELSLTFLRPVHPGGTIRASGQAIHVGRAVGLTEAFVLDDEDRLVAHGSSRLAIREIPDPPPPPDDLQPVSEEDPPTPDPYLRAVTAAPLPQEIWDELPGREVIARQIRGELPLPPICELAGLAPSEVGDGQATMVLPASIWLTSPAGTVQGGVTATLADASMMAAAATTAQAGTAIAGLDLKVNYLRPVFADGRDLVARADVLHRGRTLAIARAEVVNGEGKKVAIATGSAMYLPGRPASLAEEELGGADA